MLTCRHLTVTLPTGRVLIDDLSFSLSEGMRLGVIAEEGDGKSTLLKILAGEYPDYVRVSGFFHAAKSCGRLEQQIDPSWLSLTPLDYLLRQSPEEEIDPASWNDLAQYEQIASANDIPLDLLYAQHSLSSCSGGEKVRLQMLRLLFMKPDILLLDEPSNDLDLDATLWMEKLIQNANVPVLFISHDIRLLQNCASAILHLEARNKKTKAVSTFFTGSYDDYISQRKAARHKQKQVASSAAREYKAQKQRLNDLHNKVEGKLRTASRQNPAAAKNLKDKMRSVKSSQAILERSERPQTDSAEEEIEIRFENAPIHADRLVVDLQDIQVSAGGRQLLAPFDLMVRAGERILIRGKNGMGKTTLLRELYDRLNEDPGLQIGYMPQQYEDVFDPDQSALSYLQTFCDDQPTICDRLGSLHFTFDEMRQPVSSLSGGQKAKVFLSRFALQKTNVLLLDEPTRNLSPLSVPVFLEALEDYQGCVIAISHDRVMMEQGFTRILDLKDGQVFDHPA